MDYSVKDELLKQLVDSLRPVKRMDKPTTVIESLFLILKSINIHHFNPSGKEEIENSNLIIYVQQAAAAKTIGILARLSIQIAEQFLSVSAQKLFEILPM
jgi:hypothetical protein